MINTSEFVDQLITKEGIKEFCGVSDSTLKYLINEVTNRRIYVPFTNEGDAVAYAAGRTISGYPTAVLMQNSGLTNASSPITSLTELYKIPMIYIVGMRGGPDDEPQHEVVGNNCNEILNAISEELGQYNYYKYYTNDDKIIDTPSMVEHCRSKFYLIDKNVFSKVELDSYYKQESYGLYRPDFIKWIKDLVRDDPDIMILSTTGYTSRELMRLGEVDSQNFYMLGSMGCLISFATGVAKSYPNKKFIVLDGDGSFLMRPEGKFVCDTLNLPNVLHIIFCNGTHLSTGNQRLPKVDIKNLVKVDKDHSVLKPSTESVCKNYILNWIDSSRNTTIFIDCIAESSSDLPRPRQTPTEILFRFKEGLNR